MGDFSAASGSHATVRLRFVPLISKRTCHKKANLHPHTIQIYNYKSHFTNLISHKNTTLFWFSTGLTHLSPAPPGPPPQRSRVGSRASRPTASRRWRPSPRAAAPWRTLRPCSRSSRRRPGCEAMVGAPICDIQFENAFAGWWYTCTSEKYENQLG